MSGGAEEAADPVLSGSLVPRLYHLTAASVQRAYPGKERIDHWLIPSTDGSKVIRSVF